MWVHEPDPALGHWPLITAVCRARSVRRYLEIGVQEGRSLDAALDAGTIETLVLIDPWGDRYGGTGRGSHAHIAARLTERGYTGDVTYFDEASHAVLPRLHALRVDLIHIDGDHSYAGAFRDLGGSRRLTDLILIHDVIDPHNPEVGPAVSTFLQSTPGWESRLFRGEPEGTMLLWRTP